MKVEIRISEEAVKPYAVIYTNEMTAEVSRIASLIEDSADTNLITVTENERIFVLRPEDVYMIRVEQEKTIVYAKSEKYISNKRLYEFEAMLGNDFMRISKSVLVNLKHLDCVEPSIGGVMLLVLKNGCKDYISRKYLPAFKKYLGI
ncbi:MAG: LytTR family DNA-binding domain-containing protein [Clostridia bacterium]|nr:LytTR family DNA-binding domain-containing protein [Clostridia bacterium]